MVMRRRMKLPEAAATRKEGPFALSNCRAASVAEETGMKMRRIMSSVFGTTSLLTWRGLGC
jgi:hypothetical protein